MFKPNKTTGFLFKRLLAFIAVISVLMSYSSYSPHMQGFSNQSNPFPSSAGLFMTVSAKRLTGTANEEYRKYLEEKYGYAIIIDDSVKEKNAFYTLTAVPADVELKILKDIETAFSMTPDGFVKETNDFFRARKLSPSINVRKKSASDNEERAGWFTYADASLYIVTDGNDFIRILLHEFAHEVEYALRLKNKIGDMEKYYTELNNKTNAPYNINYVRLYDTDVSNISNEYKNAYLSIYSTKNFSEDFAETFAHAVMQPRYISSYGKGVKNPVHYKIETLSKILTEAFDSLKNTGFLLRCLPDPPASWAAESVKKAKEKGIVPWNVYGLNNAELTRYDAALILQPFLYKYIEESALLKRAGLIKDPAVPEDFVYDVLDGEDILLLHNLRIMTVGNKRFNPEWKIQKQSAAIILTRVAQLFGIEDTPNKSLTCGDAQYIADWAKPYVKFVVSLNIMGADGKNNFNPGKYITYQEFYAALLNISSLKEEYNKKNNIKLPSAPYLKTIGKGTSLSSDGWIYYYNYAFDYFSFNSYTGKGREIMPDYLYEGDFVNGLWHGKGKITWKNDGSWYEGDWRENEIHGNGKYVWAHGEYFEGNWQKGKPWNGNGRFYISEAWYYLQFADGEIVYSRKAE